MDHSTEGNVSFSEHIEASLREGAGGLLVQDDDLREYGSPEQIASFYEAFAEAQGGFTDPKKTATVRFTSRSGPVEYKYAPPAEIRKAVVPHLSKAGIACMTPGTSDGKGGAKVSVILAHKAGGRLVATMRFRADSDIKNFGGQTTYYGRYALARLCNVDAIDDTVEPSDGQSSGTAAPEPKRGGGPEAAARKDTLKRLVKALGLSVEDRTAVFEEVTGHSSTKDMSSEDGDKLIKHLQQMADENAARKEEG